MEEVSDYPPIGITYEFASIDEDEEIELEMAEEESNIIGKCANCSDPIFSGQGDSTVHYDCWNEFKNYLDQEWNQWLSR